MNRNHRRISGLAGVFLLAFPVALHAEEPVETALKGFVAGIDASPTWTAAYRGLTYDPATETATLSGLSLKTETGNVTIDVETITVAGYQAAADGGFAAHAVTADGGTVNSGFLKISLSNLALDDVAVPSLAGVAYDPGKPFTSLVRFYSEILKARLAHGRISSIAVIEKINQMTSRITYENFTIDDLKDGRIGSVHAGPLTLQAPAPEGLVGMTVGSVEAHGIDIGAMLRVYNPDAYAGGVGDMVWHYGAGGLVLPEHRAGNAGGQAGDERVLSRISRSASRRPASRTSSTRSWPIRTCRRPTCRRSARAMRSTCWRPSASGGSA